MIKPKLLRVPVRCQSKDMIFGTIKQLDNIQNLVVLLEDEEGVWLMIEHGITLERINWMLDRAKSIIHDD